MEDVTATFAQVFQLSCLTAAELAALERVRSTEARAFVRYAYREYKNNPQASQALSGLIARAATSEVALNEWVFQIVQVYTWLEQDGASARLNDIAEYVSCALEGSSLNPGHSIVWYLEQYGFACRSPLSAQSKTV